MKQKNFILRLLVAIIFIIPSSNKASVLEPKMAILTQQENSTLTNINKEFLAKKIDTKQASTEKQKSKNGKRHPEKYQITAFLLCFFLGFLGIHRFYLGYPALGVLYMLTLGLFGIGWLVDIFRLMLPDNLTPKYGCYS